VPAPPPTTAMGWEVDPDGLHEVLLRLLADYGPLPVYITENGASFDDPVPTNGRIDDAQRAAYLQTHLAALARAVADGAEVRRYCVWSLLDNFEWEQGYDKRFGIVHVDFDTLARMPKRSALWYRDFIARVRTGER
jgi:beta-glucosidase